MKTSASVMPSGYMHDTYKDGMGTEPTCMEDVCHIYILQSYTYLQSPGRSSQCALRPIQPAIHIKQ